MHKRSDINTIIDDIEKFAENSNIGIKVFTPNPIIPKQLGPLLRSEREVLPANSILRNMIKFTPSFTCFQCSKVMKKKESKKCSKCQTRFCSMECHIAFHKVKKYNDFCKIEGDMATVEAHLQLCFRKHLEDLNKKTFSRYINRFLESKRSKFKKVYMIPSTYTLQFKHYTFFVNGRFVLN